MPPHMQVHVGDRCHAPFLCGLEPAGLPFLVCFVSSHGLGRKVALSRMHSYHDGGSPHIHPSIHPSVRRWFHPPTFIPASGNHKYFDSPLPDAIRACPLGSKDHQEPNNRAIPLVERSWLLLFVFFMGAQEAFDHLASCFCQVETISRLRTMVGENRQLVTDEPVEFEK